MPFPRTVGIETENDLLISEISEGGECIRESIQGQLPEGIRIGGCRTAAKKVKRLPIATVYKFYLAENADEASVREKIEEFESAESFIVERVSKKKGKVKQFDVKEYLYNVELREKILSVFVKITQKGTVRIEEIKKIFKITEDILSGPILRTNTEWSGSGAEL